LMFLTGAGMAYAFTSVQTASFATISSAETGQASALFSTQRQIGGSLGVAFISAVMSAIGITQLSATGAVVPNLTAYHAAFIAAAILALIGAGIGLIVRDSDAAPTMKRRAEQVEQETIPDEVMVID
jgi:hypothetical protein